jgi:aldehyde dehydrogenase (NAD+)
MLFRLVELMKQHSDEIAALESLDAGRSRMRISQEEIFGPAVSVIKFRDEADALRGVDDLNV